MIVSVKSGRRVPQAVSRHLAQRLQFALGRFAGRIRRVSTFFEDQNGPRGGVDKFCRIVVRLVDGSELVAEVVDVEWEVAVDRATTRIGHTVGREVARKRSSRLIARSPDALPPGRQGTRRW